jgi:hypothetical protein
MKKLLLLASFLFIVLTAFPVKPVIKKIEVNPEKVKNGQKVTFTITFSGKKENIKSVELYNQEFPDNAPVIELRVDPGDTRNIWKAVGPIPEEAPLGIYNWEIKVIDSKNKDVVDKKFSNQPKGKSGILSFEVVL